MRWSVPVAVLCASIPFLMGASAKGKAHRDASRKADTALRQRMLGVLDEEEQLAVQKKRPADFAQLVGALDKDQKKAVLRDLHLYRIQMENPSAAEMGALGKAYLAMGETGEVSQLAQEMQEKYPREPIGYLLAAKALGALAEDAPSEAEKKKMRFHAAEAANHARDYARHKRRLDIRGQAEAIIRLAPRDGPHKVRYGRLTRGFQEITGGKKKAKPAEDPDSRKAKVHRSIRLMHRDSKTARQIIRSLVGGPGRDDLIRDLKDARIAIWPVKGDQLKDGRMAEAYRVGKNDFTLKIDERVIRENKEATLAPLVSEVMDNAAYQREHGNDSLWSRGLMYLRGKVKKVFVSYELQDAGHRFDEDSNLARENNLDVRVAEKGGQAFSGTEQAYYSPKQKRQFGFQRRNIENGVGAVEYFWDQASRDARNAGGDKALKANPGVHNRAVVAAKKKYQDELDQKNGSTRSRPIPYVKK